MENINDYEPCGTCGFDHEYEHDAAEKAHVDLFRTSLIMMYDSNDPVMSEHGLDSWEEQVDRAVVKLLSTPWSLEREYQIGKQLLNGEFYKA